VQRRDGIAVTIELRRLGRMPIAAGSKATSRAVETEFASDNIGQHPSQPRVGRIGLVARATDSVHVRRPSAQPAAAGAVKYELVRSSNECCLLHRTGPVLAQTGHADGTEQCLLSSNSGNVGGRLARSAFDPTPAGYACSMSFMTNYRRRRAARLDAMTGGAGMGGAYRR
jgi:hypothetical protein